MGILANVTFILLLMAGAWWLSGYDSGLTGEDKASDFIRRALRCGVTAVLLVLALLNGYFAIFIFVLLGVIWASCGAEFFARRFHKMVDPDDDREFDPKETERNMDALGLLIRQGRTAEALALCNNLEKSGSINPLTLEATHHRIYQDTLASIEVSPVLRDVRDFCKMGEFQKAEAGLKEILAKQPESWSAMLLLMRIYVKNLSQPQKALMFLQPVPNQPQLHPAFVQYARGSIKQWTEEVAEAKNPDAGAKAGDEVARFQRAANEAALSVDDLLSDNQLATAIERLEKDIGKQPKNFELWLKLAEVYAVYCADAQRAGKIIQKMENSSAFTAEEIQFAKSKLRDWQKGRRPG